MYLLMYVLFQKAKRIVLIHAAHNELQNLPKDLKQMPSLESLYFYGNNIKSLDGALQKSRRLMRIGLSFNKIESVSYLIKPNNNDYTFLISVVTRFLRLYFFHFS